MEKGVDTEGGEALEEEPLGHLLANEGRHLGQQLQERAGSVEVSF